MKVYRPLLNPDQPERVILDELVAPVIQNDPLCSWCPKGSRHSRKEQNTQHKDPKCQMIKDGQKCKHCNLPLKNFGKGELKNNYHG